MTTQLDLIVPETELSETNQRQLAWLEATLRAEDRWLCARHLVEISPESLNDREVRFLASHSDMLISGQKGYKHLQFAKPEESHHFLAWMESQMATMARRLQRVRRNLHRMVG